MNYNFYLVLLLFAVFFGNTLFYQDIFADVEKGKNFDTEIIAINNGVPTIKWTSATERILVGNSWIESKFTDSNDYLSLETGHGSIKLNKNTCSFEFYKKGLISGNYLFMDSLVTKMANNGTENWNEITQISNASCETYGSDYQLVAKKYASGVGFVEYKYINTGISFKTQLEATNLSSQTNKKFGFTQTIDLNRDTVIFGNSSKNLDNFNNTTLDRSWLVDNKAKVINFLNEISFDLDLSFNNLGSVYILDTGINKSKISFNYINNATIILPNSTLIIDPTYSSTSPNDNGHVIEDDGTNDVCTNPGVSVSKDNSSSTMISRISSTGFGSDCFFVYLDYDISSIPLNSTILDVDFLFDVQSVVTPRNCDYNSMGTTRANDTNANIFNAIYNGVALLTNDTSCTTAGNNKSVDLGTAGDTAVQTRLDAGTGFFTFGIKPTTVTLDGSFHDVVIGSTRDATATPKPTLSITYEHTPRFSLGDLDVQNVGDAIRVNGTLYIDSGSSSVNVTSIVYSVNGSIITTNSTGQNFTSFPATLNFGPFWYQLTTDDIYNNTVSVSVQDYLYSVYTNSTSSIASREYEPDYFEALDPSQGLVNYTFPEGNDLINVNRETGGSLFNVECQYFTQAQAFFNQLEEGVWDNQTNVLFYVGDASGFYYVRCFNDGELFVTAISQNYSNALVPGLVIFDQLGGFFGAPSIILVIISILSLGTGRNYPIILLIAASVTGILLALELLTLDPGLVVAIIVMAGIGLFGIRKFY